MGLFQRTVSGKLTWMSCVWNSQGPHFWRTKRSRKRKWFMFTSCRLFLSHLQWFGWMYVRSEEAFISLTILLSFCFFTTPCVYRWTWVAVCIAKLHLLPQCLSQSSPLGNHIQLTGFLWFLHSQVGMEQNCMKTDQMDPQVTQDIFVLFASSGSVQLVNSCFLVWAVVRMIGRCVVSVSVPALSSFFVACWSQAQCTLWLQILKRSSGCVG